jgi:single-stranded-DNA-specific exonuclease
VAFGGHEYAAGFEIKKDDLPQFRDRINQIISEKYAAAFFQREICIDLEITFYDINKTLIKNLELFRPFGRGNPKPVFLTRRLRLISVPTKLRGGGAKFSLSDGEIMYDAIWFKPNGFELICDIDYDAVYCLSFDTWFGFEKMILEIKDLQISEKSLIAEEKKQGST